MERRLAGGLLVLLVGPAVAFAQETTSGSIAGWVKDVNGGVMPGTTVTLTSGEGERALVTDGRGRFLAPFLTPGLYDVRAEMSGFAPVEQEDVRVRLGQRVDLNLTLSMGEIHETIRVVAESPVVDITSTTAGGVLDSAQLARMPVSRRLPETLYLVPGVSSSTGTGSANPSIAGGSGLDNQYVVDGVDITNQGWGALGAYSLQFGSLGSGVTTDFIQETEVKTAGFEAEYGKASGGVVNVVTKSGSNAFHGSLFGYWQPSAFESSWTQQQLDLGQVNTTQTDDLDFGVSAGGPILRDRLFYFAAFNPQYRRRTLIAPEGFPLEELGEVDRKRRNLSYAAKVSWQATDRHRFDLTLFGDPSYGPSGPQRSRALEAEDTRQFSAIDPYGGHNQALRYNGVLSRGWLLEGSVSHARTIHTEVPAADARWVRDQTVFPRETTGGLGWHDKTNEGNSLQLAVKSTHIFEAAGSHELRFGLQYEDIEFDRVTARTGPPHVFPDGISSTSGVWNLINPDPTFEKIYEVGGERGDPTTSSQQYLGWFAQDSWRIGSRLTIRPGIRWERQTISGNAPICFSDESYLGAGDGTPGNEIPCSYTWSDNWGPRLGAVFDITGSGRSKLYASWGRFFSKLPNNIAIRAMTGSPSARADYFDPELTQLVPDGVLAAGRTEHFQAFPPVPALFAPGSRSTYHDEFLAGVEFEAARMLNIGVRYIHRRLPRVLEDYTPAQMILWDLDFGGVLEALGDQIYVIDNIHAGLETLEPAAVGFPDVPQAFHEDPVRKYDAVEVTATRAFSGRWSLFASYRWSRLTGNFEGFFRSDNGQSDPAITSLFDFPPNDPSYTEVGTPLLGYQGDVRYQGSTLGNGPLPNDRTHQVKVYGTYTPGDLNIGVGLLAGTGQPLTALAAHPLYGNGGEIPETLRGAGFETADGLRTRSPGFLSLDVHLDYTFRFGQQRLMLIADVFNALNNQDPVSYNPFTQEVYPFENPDFGTPYDPASTVSAFRTPRQVRLGVRFEW